MDVNGSCGGVLVWGTVALAAVLIATRGAAATVFIVGDASGWTLAVDYSTWANGKPFTVGDSIVFNYASGAHTVEEVRKGDYQTCTTGNSITVDSSGSTTILLKTAGTHYFICGMAGHCSSGMKIAITVVSAGSTTISPPSTGTSNNCPGTQSTPTTVVPNTYYYPYGWSMGTRVRRPLGCLFIPFVVAFVRVFWEI